jgi:hypothetical protein
MASASLLRILRVANGLHVGLYRLSGGKLANRIANMPILLITTFGRKTGRPHTNPVVYLRPFQPNKPASTAERERDNTHEPFAKTR